MTYKTDEWQILLPNKELRIYSHKDVTFKKGRQIIHSPALDEHIEKVWNNELKNAEKSGRILTNGPLLRLDSIVTGKEYLDLYVALTNYKEFKATCLPAYRERFEKATGRELRDDEIANTFVSATVPITIDDHIVFLQRSDKVDLFREDFNLPSGGKWDGNPAETYEAMLKSSEDLFGRCRKIVSNEFNGQADIDEKSQKLLGVYESTQYKDNVLSFTIGLNDEIGHVLEKEQKIIGKGNKYQGIFEVEFKEGKLIEFINRYSRIIPASITPALVLAGAHKFGEDWPLSIKGVKKAKP